MTKRLCEICKLKVKDLEAHLDQHTPYWSGKKITLSGADQIRIILKDFHGNWEYLKKHALKHKHAQDYLKVEALERFEILNKIQFKSRKFDEELHFIESEKP